MRYAVFSSNIDDGLSLSTPKCVDLEEVATSSRRRKFDSSHAQSGQRELQCTFCQILASSFVFLSCGETTCDFFTHLWGLTLGKCRVPSRSKKLNSKAEISARHDFMKKGYFFFSLHFSLLKIKCCR